MKTSRFKVLAVAAVVLALAAGAGGCGGKKSATAVTAGGSSTPPANTSAASTAPASAPVAAPAGGGGSGACHLISTAEAAQVAGTAVQPGVERSLPVGPGVTATFCTYTFKPGNAPAVLIAVAKGRAIFDEFRREKSSESDFKEISGVGDEAFFASGNLNVRKGETGLILSVAKAGPPRGIGALDDIRRLAALVLPRV